MEYQKMEKKRIAWTIALVMVSLIAVAGFVVAYVQYDQKQNYMAQATEALNSQEKRVMESYDRIESNLAKITQYEEMIKGNVTDAESNSSLSPEERIQNEISMIEQLISENNQIIADLNSQIKEKDTRLASYSKTVKDLQARVAEYKTNVEILVAEKVAIQKNLDETTIAKHNLEGEVVNLGTEVAQKSNVIEEQNAQLLEKERNLHTAYYTVGTYKSLHEQNIVEKEGGFLGINREKNLSNGLDNEKFEEIDTRNVTEIPVDAKRCEIITDQDPSTYSLVYADDKVSKIKITNPAKFWGKSKYLVVVVRESNFDETADSR
jgi:chromosome segregation ATPase